MEMSLTTEVYEAFGSQMKRHLLSPHQLILKTIVYILIQEKKDPATRLVREREHFSGSIMVWVGVSRIGKTNVVFVETGDKSKQ